MDDWDRVSHCIAELNQHRVLAEANTVNAVNSILDSLEKCKRTLSEPNLPLRNVDALSQLLSESEDTELVSRRRDEQLHNALSQLKQALSSALDQEESDLEDLGLGSVSLSDSEMIENALAWHFLHEGFLETAKVFSKETGLNCLPDTELIRSRQGLEATEAIVKRRDLSPAIAWLEEHSSPTSSNLLFDLHKLRFLQLAASQTEAIGYAQRHFAPFAPTRSQEIQTLLGGLLFQSTAALISPNYQTGNTNDERIWEQAKASMLKEINRVSSSMSTLILTGSRAIAELRIYQRLVGTDSKLTPKSWTDHQELPIQLENLTHFHSEFWCPVSQEKTDYDSNPPMLLTCGHVVAKSSMLRIAKGRQRFKCPTCPTEQAVDAAVPIYF